jgi:hypothetical protein
MKDFYAEFDFIKFFKLACSLKHKKKLIIEFDNGVYYDKDEHGCIHTKLTDISIEEYNEYIERRQFSEGTDSNIVIPKKTKKTEIKLTEEEDFNALKSWTETIANSKESAFLIQTELESQYGNNDYSLFHFLFKFIIKYNKDFFFEYADLIEKEIAKLSYRSQSYIDANCIIALGSLLALTKAELINEEESNYLLEKIFGFNPSIKIFQEKSLVYYLRSDMMKYYPNFNKLMEKNIVNYQVAFNLLLNPHVYENYPEYVDYFLENDFKELSYTILYYHSGYKYFERAIRRSQNAKYIISLITTFKENNQLNKIFFR